jgi:hypothetical protein
MSILTLQLPDKVTRQLALVANRSGKTPARLVRETVEARLAGVQLPFGRRSSLYDLSADLCGSAVGCPRDLASNKKHQRLRFMEAVVTDAGPRGSRWSTIWSKPASWIRGAPADR